MFEDLMVETKEERFKRVAEKRVNNILESLRVLSNCSNRRVYHWSDDQLKKIWTTIDKEVKSTKQSFEIKKDKKFQF